MTFGRKVYVKVNHIQYKKTTYRSYNFPSTIMHKWCKVLCKFTPVLKPAETDKEKLSRTEVRNVSQTLTLTIAKLSEGEESEKTALQCSDDHSTSLSNSLSYMKSHIKEIWVLCKLLLNWCIRCEHFVWQKFSRMNCVFPAVFLK